VPVQKVKKGEHGQISIAVLTILIPEATNVRLLPSLLRREASYDRFLNIGRERGIPRGCRSSLSPGLRARSFYGQSSTKEASAEERG